MAKNDPFLTLHFGSGWFWYPKKTRKVEFPYKVRKRGYLDEKVPKNVIFFVILDPKMGPKYFFKTVLKMVISAYFGLNLHVWETPLWRAPFWYLKNHFLKFRSPALKQGVKITFSQKSIFLEKKGSQNTLKKHFFFEKRRFLDLPISSLTDDALGEMTKKGPKSSFFHFWPANPFTPSRNFERFQDFVFSKMKFKPK